MTYLTRENVTTHEARITTDMITNTTARADLSALRRCQCRLIQARSGYRLSKAVLGHANRTKDRERKSYAMRQINESARLLYQEIERTKRVLKFKRRCLELRARARIASTERQRIQDDLARLRLAS